MTTVERYPHSCVPAFLEGCDQLLSVGDTNDGVPVAVADEGPKWRSFAKTSEGLFGLAA